MTSTLNEGKRAAESAYQDAQPWVIRLARWGYATKGVVYLIVGGLALGLLACFGSVSTDL